MKEVGKQEKIENSEKNKLNVKPIGIFLFVLFGLSFAFAGTPIDTSDVLLLAYYYDPAGQIDLYNETNAVKWQFQASNIEAETPQYIDAWINYSQGTRVDPNVKIHLRIRGDGWVIAWINEAEAPHGIADAIYWYANSNSNPTELMPAKGIQWMMAQIGHTYTASNVKYYSYKYPTATKLVLFGDRLYTSSANSSTFEFQKQGINDLSLYLCWSNHYHTSYGLAHNVQFKKFDDGAYTMVAQNTATVGCQDLKTATNNPYFNVIEGTRYQVYNWVERYSTFKTAVLSFVQ
ncbi:MAG: hypothetical protein KAS30_05775 [Candidatus Diapherotrites archaeon]|nr:hypothetical protein [Candidatus Diapherotrites archaeon]